MAVRSKCLFLAAAVALAGSAHAEGLKQVGTIAIPGAPITSFGVIYIDPTNGRGYLADKDNGAVDIIDTRTDTYVGRIGGFAGNSKGGASAGPNGVIVVNDGTELWASDGDSTIKVIDPTAGKIVDTIATGGKKRANAMAYDPKDRVIIVANPNEEPPFLSLVSTQSHKILAKIPVEDAAESLERSEFYAPTGTFYTDVPMLRADHANGALAETDPKTGKLTLHEIDHCNPHSIAIVSDATMFLGCAMTQAGSPAPGGELAIFDVGTGKAVSYLAGLGGQGDTAVNPALGLFYQSASNNADGPKLRVIDIKSRKLLQAVPTSIGAHSMAVDLAGNHVYLPTTTKDGPCGGCIQVFAPQ
jgi:DNA-binding beta-propeller fold protein YncE